VHRLHQEDFCQALGIPPERKYASEGGPTFKSCFTLLREAASRPAIEVLRLLDAVLFNLVVGNADAHGKNFSLLYQADAITLAPLYDLLCTEAYPELSPKPAMKIAGVATLKDLTARSWQKFSDDIEISQPYLRRRIKEICRAVQEYAPAIASAIAGHGFDPASLEHYVEIVGHRTELIVTTVE
jgi:serine/threonine-protein kinase HipA